MTGGRKRLRGSPYTLWEHTLPAPWLNSRSKAERESSSAVIVTAAMGDEYTHHPRGDGTSWECRFSGLDLAQWTRAALNDVPRWWEGLQLGGTAINHTTVLTLSWRWLCTSVESIYDINVWKINREHIWNSLWFMWFCVCASSQGLDGNKHREHSGGLGGRSQNPFAPQYKNICLNVCNSFTCNSQKMNNPDVFHWVSG